MIFIQTFISRSSYLLEQNRKLLLRLSTLAFVLFSSAYLGYRAARVNNPVLIFYHPLPILIIGLTIVIITLKWPQVGPIGLILTSIVVTLSFGTGSQSPLEAPVLLLILLIGLWLLDMIIGKRSIRLIKSRVITPLLAFSIVVFIAFGFGQLTWFAFASTAPLRAQLGGLALFLLSFGAFLLVGHQIKELRWLERLTWTFLLLSAIIVTGQLIPAIGKINSHFIYFVITKGSLFWTWLAAIAFSQAVFNSNLKLHWRFALVALALAMFFNNLLMNHDWLSGWMPPLVAILVILWLGMPKLRVPVALIVLAVAFFYYIDISGFIMTGDNTYSLSTRLAAWKIVIEIAKVNPIFGLGPANYYWITRLFPIMGYNVVFNSHNNYVDIFAQSGLLGVVCFFWFVAELGRLGLSLQNKFTNTFANAYVYGVLGGLVGSVVAGALGDWVLPFVYNTGFQGFHSSLLGWMFMGGLLALEGMHNRSSESRLNEDSI